MRDAPTVHAQQHRDSQRQELSKRLLHRLLAAPRGHCSRAAQLRLD